MAPPPPPRVCFCSNELVSNPCGLTPRGPLTSSLKSSSSDRTVTLRALPAQPTCRRHSLNVSIAHSTPYGRELKLDVSVIPPFWAVCVQVGDEVIDGTVGDSYVRPVSG